MAFRSNDIVIAQARPKILFPFSLTGTVHCPYLETEKRSRAGTGALVAQGPVRRRVDCKVAAEVAEQSVQQPFHALPYNGANRAYQELSPACQDEANDRPKGPALTLPGEYTLSTQSTGIYVVLSPIKPTPRHFRSLSLGCPSRGPEMSPLAPPAVASSGSPLE
ncbi:hypothetical protein ACRALDRAFT_1072028 [Sodiomyces alcalophilus JCM 7366]|uniref:uncharacterized protein n=1 Tax=Sodiomyces alcalophilus JCM 7366 TaxID=591952 RepID=UPI0039B3B4EC